MRDRQCSKHERARPVPTTKVSFAEHCRDDRGERSPVLTITTPAQDATLRRELLPFGICTLIVMTRSVAVKYHARRLNVQVG